MEIIRLFTDSEGLTALETIKLPMTPEDELGHLTATFPAIEAVICETEKHFKQDWHSAPRRLLVTVLAGIMEIKLRNGTTCDIKPGQVLLTEDMGGDGHQTRAKGDACLRTIIIPLA